MENTDFGSKILILNPQNSDFEFSRLACLVTDRVAYFIESDGEEH